MKTMEKTEKTMLELEIDYNQRAWEWSRLTESGTSLEPKYGPGYTGKIEYSYSLTVLRTEFE